MGTDLMVELWRDEHGVVRELVQFGLDEIGGACIIRERNSLDELDGDVNEGDMVVARFGDPEAARDFLWEEGFEPV
ncbi:hypothetical protein GETHLI_30910 [Geothrix limicola]|uniref:DUF2007 domain-containing protein n=1 Tax=Geothrix limicola TaxID=2927978 RepID=A0ABQ5QIA5_9BACT|nr:hypothetical protein [Geothrix limicola]GLH74589.1 hypothetical protein GETHLI_30910 [Geothrix limicola]